MVPLFPDTTLFRSGVAQLPPAVLEVVEVGRRGLDDRLVEAGSVVEPGVVVGGDGAGARRVERPRRRARDDPADDRADAARGLVALAVAEAGAAGLAVAAVAVGAPAGRAGALAAAEAAAATAAAAAAGVAVHVVRSEERRVGKEWVRTGRSWWSPYH